MIWIMRSKAGGMVNKHHTLFDVGHQWLREGSDLSWFAELGLSTINSGRSMYASLQMVFAKTFVDTETTQLSWRFGAGCPEIGAPDDAIVPEAVFGLILEKQLYGRQEIKADLDYFPDWSNFTGFASKQKRLRIISTSNTAEP